MFKYNNDNTKAETWNNDGDDDNNTDNTDQGPVSI